MTSKPLLQQHFLITDLGCFLNKNSLYSTNWGIKLWWVCLLYYKTSTKAHNIKHCVHRAIYIFTSSQFFHFFNFSDIISLCIIYSCRWKTTSCIVKKPGLNIHSMGAKGYLKIASQKCLPPRKSNLGHPFIAFYKSHSRNIHQN